MSMVDGWEPTIAFDDLEDRRTTKVTVDGEGVLLARDGERLFAVSARCTHQGAPLQRGPVRFGSLPQVTCPVHGSIFALEDGRVLRGPAMAPLPRFETRVTDGVIELRRAD
jgi:nitrite reductase/ring-hydroxylating ferredoxin subunit